MTSTPPWENGNRNATTFPPELNTSVAHPARTWNHWLGGKDHFAVDREVGDELAATMPEIVTLAHADREFLDRAVGYLAETAGIRRFLDIGTGIPTADNTHEVAQRIAPEARVVYVDNDPIVLAHARALLVGTPQGATHYIDADLRDPDTILRGAARTLDLTRPTALTLLGVLEFLSDEEDPYGIVRRLVRALPSGSYLVVSHSARSEGMSELERRWNAGGATPVHLRDSHDVARFFEGMELVEPGIVALPRWRPTEETSYTDRDVAFLGAVARSA